jgi:hypothetical protein
MYASYRNGIGSLWVENTWSNPTHFRCIAEQDNSDNKASDCICKAPGSNLRRDADYHSAYSFYKSLQPNVGMVHWNRTCPSRSLEVIILSHPEIWGSHGVEFTYVSEVLAASITKVTSLIMEAANTSETSVHFYQTTWCFNLEDSHLLFIISFKAKWLLQLILPIHKTYLEFLKCTKSGLTIHLLSKSGERYTPYSNRVQYFKLFCLRFWTSLYPILLQIQIHCYKDNHTTGTVMWSQMFPFTWFNMHSI